MYLVLTMNWDYDELIVSIFTNPFTSPWFGWLYVGFDSKLQLQLGQPSNFTNEFLTSTLKQSLLY